MTDKIVANTSKAYGYNYASLSDIANQGFTIPKMKTGTDGEKEYVYYYDAELKEWVRGAEIVVPEMKGSNSAQRYGSAITYARRYTTLLALSLACDDDKKIETQAPVEEKTAVQKNGQAERWQGLQEDLNIKDLADEFRKLYTQEEQERQKYVNFKKYGKK